VKTCIGSSKKALWINCLSFFRVGTSSITILILFTVAITWMWMLSCPEFFFYSFSYDAFSSIIIQMNQRFCIESVLFWHRLDFNVPMSFRILYWKGVFMSFFCWLNFKLKLKRLRFIIHISLRLLAVSNLGNNPVLFSLGGWNFYTENTIVNKMFAKLWVDKT
jgi:hypothetical protein